MRDIKAGSRAELVEAQGAGHEDKIAKDNKDQDLKGHDCCHDGIRDEQQRPSLSLVALVDIAGEFCF